MHGQIIATPSTSLEVPRRVLRDVQNNAITMSGKHNIWHLQRLFLTVLRRIQVDKFVQKRRAHPVQEHAGVVGTPG